jgi:ATP phosphoribosyltransferase regulatory subunit
LTFDTDPPFFVFQWGVTPPRLYVPAGADAATAARLRGEGWATIAGLDRASDNAAEARRLRCSHWLEGANVVAAGEEHL